MEAFTVHPEVKKKLLKLFKSKNIEKFDIKFESVSENGDNYFGMIARTIMTGKQNHLPIIFNWIIKCAPQVKLYREFTNISFAYKREVYLYKELFPIFENFQTRQNILDPFNSTVAIHMTCLEPYQECVVMEDVKALGFESRNRMEFLDYKHVCLVLKTYGKFHALSYALKDQLPELFSTLKENTLENYFTNFNIETLQKQQENHCDRIICALDPERDGKYVEMLKKYKIKGGYLLIDTIKKAESDPLSVICHGDSWISSMLFKYENTHNEPTKVCLVDFQLSRYGSPAFDLSYFIFACTSKELRDKYYEQLLRTYYYSLCLHLAELGSDSEKIITFNALQEQMKKYSVLGYYFTQIILYLMLRSCNDAPTIDGNITDDSSGVLKNRLRNEADYRERVRGVVVDFIDNGYLDIHL